ncbi:MAG: class I SAM-dependent methyltransferase [Phenylobacterium sp.]
MAWDIALAPFAMAARLVLRAAARIDRRTPLSLRVLDGSGVGLVRRHYYTPLLREDDLHRPLDQERRLPGLDLNAAGQLALLAEFRFADELRRMPLEAAGDGYHYRNGAYEQGDGEILYDMIRHFRPRRIIEVGSGFSTRMAAEAIRANRRADPSYACRQTCIEPYEAPWLESLGVEVIRQRVELVDQALFAPLAAGDILFIDSSHVIRPQGDVVTEYLEILPSLAPGVIVQVHDIFTPRDYPRQWIVEERRLWDEQYLLEAFLAFNRAFEVIAAVNWLAHNHRDKLAEAAPMLLQTEGCEPGAFWIRRRGPS